MGNQQCCAPSQSVSSSAYYGFVMGEDNLETDIDHETDIECLHHEIRKTLLDCSIKLKQSRKLFKDKQMSTAAVLLKSPGSDSEVRCTYERPYVFLKDEAATRGKNYRILDAVGHRPQQILVKDEVMQSLGVFLCFLSQHNSLIRQVVSTEPNNYGIAAIHTHSQGNSSFLYIDDYILCSDKRPIFAQPIEGKYMWPCLVEKAWLKIKRSLQHRIQKGSPAEIFQTFLTYPLKTYKLGQDKAESKALLAKTILVLHPDEGCFVTSKKEPGHKIGLSGRQHFYLLKAFEFQGVKMYFLRNPCGPFDFRGTHRVLDAAVRQKLEQERGTKEMVEGDFVIDEQQFLEQMDQLTIIYYRKRWDTISATPLQLDVEVQEFVKVEIREKSLVSIHLEQNSLSQHALTYQIVSLGDLTLLSGTANEEGCFGMHCVSLLDKPFLELPPQQYLIRLKKKSLDGARPKQPSRQGNDLLIVTAHSSAIITPLSDAQEGKQIFTECLGKIGKSQLGWKKSDPLQIDADHTAFWVGDLFVIYVEKKNESKEEINLQVCFSDLVNLRCISHPIGKEYTVIKHIRDSVVIIFQKVELAAETSVTKYVIEPF